MPEGRGGGAAEAQLRDAGGERRRRVGADERGDAAAEAAGTKPETATGVPPNGNDGAGSLETSARLAGTISQHLARLAFRAFSPPVRSLYPSFLNFRSPFFFGKERNPQPLYDRDMLY